MRANVSRRHRTGSFVLLNTLQISILALALSSWTADPVLGQAAVYVPAEAPARIHALPTLREQAWEQQAWVEKRVKEVLPALMREYGVDMWILTMREYAEDPVFFSMVAPTTFAARRRSIYVFYDRGPAEGLEALALGGGSQGGLYQAYRSTRPTSRGESGELVGDEQWRLLRELVEDRDPSNIVVNIDETHAFSDGLHAGEREALERALGPTYAGRLEREPRLAVNFIGHRIPEMLPRFRKMMETVHALISQAFSNSVITPGVTTTQDVVWWLRQSAQDLGYTVWFQPSVSVSRAGDVPREGPVVIQRGDLLHTDVGIVAQNLHTDTQHHGYVLRDGEREPPEGLKQCLRNSNRLQDIVVGKMEPGLAGNEILADALAQMRSEGITGTVYGHPVGDHGHGSGPLIGRWDAQEGVPVRGELLLRPSTWHAIELQAITPIPEWGDKPVSCRQEEDVYIDEQGARHWVFRRQTAFHLVW